MGIVDKENPAELIILRRRMIEGRSDGHERLDYRRHAPAPRACAVAGFDLVHHFRASTFKRNWEQRTAHLTALENDMFIPVSIDAASPQHYRCRRAPAVRRQ